MLKKSAGKGSYKARFKSKEWDQVVWVPVHVMMLTASADGLIDRAETKRFAERAVVGLIDKDPLYREVAEDLARAIATRDNKLFRLNADPMAVQALLRRKLTPAEYQGFMHSVLRDAVAVAAASDGVSKEERELLGAIAAVWGVDLSGF